MIPTDGFNSNSNPAQFLLGPRSVKNRDREFGGVALNNTSEPFTYIWEAYWDSGYICVKRIDQPTGTQVIPVAQEPTVIGLAFDRLMQIQLVWELDEPGTKFYHYWYDTVTSSYTITTYTDCYCPCISQDDVRKRTIHTSDVILVYNHLGASTGLMYRTLYDRFQTEVSIVSEGAANLHQIGMDVNFKFQIKTLTCP